MKNLLFIVVLLVIFSCERIDFNDFEKGMDEETEVEDIPFLLDETFADSTKWNDCDEDVEMNRGKTYQQGQHVSVTAFLGDSIGCDVFVQGYIVGACTKSLKNAEWRPPFTYAQAVLLAAQKNERAKCRLISVQLPSGSKIRNDLNLVDHPEHLNMPIAILASQGENYLGIPGIKPTKSTKYFILKK